MTLEQTICECTRKAEANRELAKYNKSHVDRANDLKNAEECEQLAAWLRELKERRKADSCEGCVKKSGKSNLLVCYTCRRHYHYADLYKPARRTDENNNVYV